MNYKPYTVEWSRRRYLEEAIQQYFDTNASTDIVLGDIVSILEENINLHRNRAKSFEEVLHRLLDNDVEPN